jgi:hypothetical protein
MEKPVNIVETAVLDQMFWKLVRKVVMMIFKSSLNMGRLGSKTRSHSSNIGKPVNILETTVFLHYSEAPLLMCDYLNS